MYNFQYMYNICDMCDLCVGLILPIWGTLVKILFFGMGGNPSWVEILFFLAWVEIKRGSSFEPPPSPTLLGYHYLS
mgnify:FL=1